MENILKSLKMRKGSDEEWVQQSELVMSIFRKIEDSFDDEQKTLVQSLLVETNVLNTIYKYYEMDESLED